MPDLGVYVSVENQFIFKIVILEYKPHVAVTVDNAVI
jgi:hypothetical protein